MAMTYDLAITGGKLVCGSAVKLGDIGIRGGEIVDISDPGELPGGAIRTIDAEDNLVMPGLVDLHVHLAEEDSGEQGHGMLARAGVTTALDLTGPTEETVRLAATHGAGLNIAVVEAIRPEKHLPLRPTPGQIRDALSRILAAGAIGVKLHIDAGWGPDETAAIIAEAAKQQLWIALHCGTTASASDLTGLEEGLRLADGARVQIAHVNSYCRGDIADPVREAERAIELLRAAPNAVGESYLDRFNATSGHCIDGEPVNRRLRGWLERAGFEPTERGVVRAIRADWAGVVVQGDEVTGLVSGEAGVAHYRAAGTQTLLCLPVNPAASRVLLAASKSATGAFDVPALATDGGGIPRNTTLSAGLALVELGFLTLPELVQKASTTPAGLLGLQNKGTLSDGADADVTIVDARTRAVSATIAGGRIVYSAGQTLRETSRLLTTRAEACGWAGPKTALELASSGLISGQW
ncbi:amidohydrolase family protein [Leucobacter albus]|uniref:Amidohydrolase family protein n=1 Tax=Leucobacter albus TaxID=272210 RepID=A0ABW3TM75_9MICO